MQPITHRLCIYYFVVLTGLLSLPVIGLAQQAPSDRQPATPAHPYPPQSATRHAEAAATLAARTPLDYRIAYLITEEAADTMPVLTPDVLEEATGAIMIDDWEYFLEANADVPFDMVVFHTSMFDAVDVDWFHAAYRNNVIIIGLNTPFQQMKTLTGDKCMKKDSSHVLDADEQTFVVRFTLSVSATTEEDRQAVIRATVDDCIDNTYELVSGYTSLNYGRMIAPLTDTPADIDWFVDFLRAETMSYDERTPAPSPTP